MNSYQPLSTRITHIAMDLELPNYLNDMYHYNML